MLVQNVFVEDEASGMKLHPPEGFGLIRFFLAPEELNNGGSPVRLCGHMADGPAFAHRWLSLEGWLFQDFEEHPGLRSRAQAGGFGQGAGLSVLRAGICWMVTPKKCRSKALATARY